MFFQDPEVKKRLIILWARYKIKYSIKLFDFAILDNHAHLLLFSKSSNHLGGFMRDVNSQIARFINKRLGRDSQAIRERYKSPVIGNERYMINTIQYIYMNRYKVTGVRPERDPWCSASWHYNKIPPLQLFLNCDKKEIEAIKGLLDPHEDLPLSGDKADDSYLKYLINEAIEKLRDLTQKIYENGQTIADRLAVSYRARLLSAHAREYTPQYLYHPRE